MNELTILTITRGQSYALPFLQRLSRFAESVAAEYLIGMDTYACDECEFDMFDIGQCRLVPCTSEGAIEHVLADVSQRALGKWVLRIDDDETMSAAMEQWIRQGDWLDGEDTHYSFPTAWLWGDEDHYLVNDRMFPDPHTRLVTRDFMKDWPRQPHGKFTRGKFVPALLLHHKFLIKSYGERQTIAAQYDSLGNGLGTNEIYKRYGLPEDVFSEYQLAEVGTGILKGWFM